MDNRPIGLFDSGVGGLTVLQKLINVLPYENTIYFADTARFPYGPKPKEIVLQYSKQIINFLKSLNVKAIIIACNTVSSNCYQILQQEFKDIPILDIITSGVDEALNSTKNYKIGILATENTVKSSQYEKKIKILQPKASVFSVSCPEFAILAENGDFNSDNSLKIAKKYILPILEKNIDTLVLGCTHYPLLLDTINKIVPKNISIINPADNLANKIKITLKHKNMLNSQTTNSFNYFYTSRNSLNFNSMCNFILNKNCTVQSIDIEKF